MRQALIDGSTEPFPVKVPRGHKRPRLEIKVTSHELALFERAIAAEASAAGGPREKLGTWIVAAAITRAAKFIDFAEAQEAPTPIRWRSPKSANAPKDQVLCGDQKTPRRWYRVTVTKVTAEFRRNRGGDPRKWGAHYWSWESNNGGAGPFPSVTAAQESAETHAKAEARNAAPKG